MRSEASKNINYFFLNISGPSLSNFIIKAATPATTAILDITIADIQSLPSLLIIYQVILIKKLQLKLIATIHL